MPSQRDFHLFAGSSHPVLAKACADKLAIPLGKRELGRFCDEEISLQIQESVRGHKVFVLQTVALDPNNYLMELLVMIDALKRASAKEIIAVIPYFGYCRQDRKDKPRAPITAKLVANLLQSAGVTRVLTIDLHTEQLQGFFDIPLDNVYAIECLLEGVRELDLGDFVVVSPDIGSIKLARHFASRLNADFAIVDKHRKGANDVEALSVIGDVKGKNVLLADDMCTTGSTILSAAKACREKGAKEIFAAVTHGLFVGDAIENIEKSDLKGIVTCDTIPRADRFKASTKIQTVSVAPLIAQAIRCIIEKESFTSLYR